MTKSIREKINKLEQHAINSGSRLIRIILEEICDELDKHKKLCLDSQEKK